MKSFGFDLSKLASAVKTAGERVGNSAREILESLQEGRAISHSNASSSGNNSISLRSGVEGRTFRPVDAIILDEVISPGAPTSGNHMPTFVCISMENGVYEQHNTKCAPTMHFFFVGCRPKRTGPRVPARRCSRPAGIRASNRMEAAPGLPTARAAELGLGAGEPAKRIRTTR